MDIGRCVCVGVFVWVRERETVSCTCITWALFRALKVGRLQENEGHTHTSVHTYLRSQAPEMGRLQHNGTTSSVVVAFAALSCCPGVCVCVFESLWRAEAFRVAQVVCE